MASKLQDDLPSIQFSPGESRPLLGYAEPRIFSIGWWASIRWALHLRLALAFVACCLACGVLAGFPALEPLLIGAGLFESYCPNGSFTVSVLGNASSPSASPTLSQTPTPTPASPGVGCLAQQLQLGTLYTLSIGVTFGLLFFIGIAYDRFGPRVAGVAGAIGSALGFVLIGISLRFPSLQWIAYIGFPLADLMGQYNSLAVFGFVWHYPKWQALIVGLANASYTISSVNATIFTALVGKGWTISNCLFLVAGLGLASALLSYYAVPSLDEYNIEIKRSVGFTMEEAALPIPTIIIQILKSFRANLEINLTYFASVVVQYVCISYWVAQVFGMLAEFFSANETDAIAGNFSTIFSIVGTVGSVFLGTLVDLLGLKIFNVFVQALFMATVGLMFIKSIAIQYLVIVVATCFVTAWTPFLVKWGLVYASPKVTGTFFTGIFSVAAIFQLAINIGLPQLMPRIATGVMVFIWPLAISGGLGVLLGIAFSVHFTIYHKIPASPPLVD